MKLAQVEYERLMLHVIADKKFAMDDVAVTYAFCIESSEKPDFSKINRAIVKRWSVSGLAYIKERAWKLVEERRSKRVDG